MNDEDRHTRPMTRERPARIDLQEMRQASYELQGLSDMALGQGAAPEDVGAIAWSRFMTPELGVAVGHLLEIIAADAEEDAHDNHVHCHAGRCAVAAAQVVTEKVFKVMKGEQ